MGQSDDDDDDEPEPRHRFPRARHLLCRLQAEGSRGARGDVDGPYGCRGSHHDHPCIHIYPGWILRGSSFDGQPARIEMPEV